MGDNSWANVEMIQDPMIVCGPGNRAPVDFSNRPRAQHKKKIEVLKDYIMPSGGVFILKLESEVLAYLFSEFKYGEDWWSDQPGAVIVREHVLLQLQLRYS